MRIHYDKAFISAKIYTYQIEVDGHDAVVLGGVGRKVAPGCAFRGKGNLFMVKEACLPLCSDLEPKPPDG